MGSKNLNYINTSNLNNSMNLTLLPLSLLFSVFLYLLSVLYLLNEHLENMWRRGMFYSSFICMPLNTTGNDVIKAMSQSTVILGQNFLSFKISTVLCDIVLLICKNGKLSIIRLDN